MAFPGGRFDEEGKGELKWENPLHIKFEAVREFKEECGSVLNRVGKVGKEMAGNSARRRSNFILNTQTRGVLE